jgi:hypothetical protein
MAYCYVVSKPGKEPAYRFGMGCQSACGKRAPEQCNRDQQLIRQMNIHGARIFYLSEQGVCGSPSDLFSRKTPFTECNPPLCSLADRAGTSGTQPGAAVQADCAGLAKPWIQADISRGCLTLCDMIGEVG